MDAISTDSYIRLFLSVTHKSPFASSTQVWLNSHPFGEKSSQTTFYYVMEWYKNYDMEFCNLQFSKGRKEVLTSDRISDKEIDILMKEFELIRNESVNHQTLQIQFVGAAGILIGALTALSPLMLTIDKQDTLTLKIPPPYFIIVLLVISLLFTSLQYGYLLQDFEIGNIAKRVTHIRESICQLLGLDNKTTTILNWDHEHSQLFNPSSSFGYISSIVFSFSRYFMISLPALVSLIAAILLNVTNFSYPLKGVDWINIIFTLFDILYFLLIIPGGVYVYKTYLDLRNQ